MRSIPRSGARLVGAALALCLLVAPATTRVAGAADKDKKPKKNQAFVHPAFASFGVRSVAVLPWSSVQRDPAAEKVMRHALENALQPVGYRFVSETTALALARRAGIAEPLTVLRGRLLAGAAPDSVALRSAAHGLAVDAFLVANLTTYQRYVVAPEVRGQSFTQVGADLVLVSGRTGETLWRGSFVERGDGPYNDPQAGEGRDFEAAGLGGSSRLASALEPPAFEDVALKLMRRAVATLPAVPQAPAAAPAP